MKKRLLLLAITLMMIVGMLMVFTLPAAAADAPTNLRIEPSETNGIPAQIDAFMAKTGGTNQNPTYTYQLYLPGNANVDACFLSWDGGATVTVNGTSYASGECPIPSPCDFSQTTNTTTTYTFKDGNTTLTSLQFITYQGSDSEDVQSVFIVIDETYTTEDEPWAHTIAAMDGDTEHEKYCVGDIYINGMKYDLDKIKGRGNATWKEALDKKPYNIKIGSKIVFPGIDSEATKNWSFLAENLDRSLLGNRAGYYLAYELGIGQDTTSADVWMNGEYQGCYTVTAKTDSFVKKNGYMIEQDNYEEGVDKGGDPQFQLDGLNEVSGNTWWNSRFNRITVKKIGDNLLKNDAGVVVDSPENQDYVSQNIIKPWLQDAWNAIRSEGRNSGYGYGYNSNGEYYTDYVDIESFAKMYLMHEYVKSYDVCAGSILFHRDGKTDADKLIAGPLWDLDNAMGSTYRNDMLGNADDRRNGDRRSGEGDFIQNITEYKTSIYKTISQNEDFMEEVYRQYNLNKAYFDNLPDYLDEKISEIRDSALMNHIKVEELTHNTGKDNHYYSTDTTLGSGVYRQTYLHVVENNKPVWANYAANLKTYVATRSLWFANNYYAADIVCDEGASVTVYKTSSIDGEHEDNAAFANPRNSTTGKLDYSGNGEINFVVNVKPGYVMQSVTTDPATGSYTSMTGPDATTGLYRITGVKGAFTINVTTTAIEYPITFVDEDETTVLQSSNVAYGATPVYTGETPTKDPDAQYTYTFAGWTPEVVPVTGEATYTATYTPSLRSYTVTFKNEDGTELQSSNVAYGTTPIYTGATPTKAPDEQYTYIFAGWTPDIVAVSGPATYTATYSASELGHTITLDDLTNGNADITVISDGGSYSGAVTFKVNCANACAVWYSTDGGKTYTRLTPAEDGSYTMNVDQDMLLAVNIMGDINNDGDVNNKDVTRLMRYIKYHDVEAVDLALDVNGDGEVNNKDVTRLMRYIKYGDVRIF